MKEALKLALEALEDRASLMKWQMARDAVKAALAQPEQEPNGLAAYVIGCFGAAEAEGLQEALAETTDERLKDLVERRLMYALYEAQKPQRKEPEQEPVAWMDIDEKGSASGLRYWSEPDNRHEVALYTTPPQPEERNFCPRCGKRTADLTVIHTCTPPQENT